MVGNWPIDINVGGDAALDTENEQRCQPPLDREELERIAHSVSRYAPAETKPDTNTTKKTSGLIIITASSIEPKRVDWLWHHRLPKGKISLVSGDPSVGKSTMFVDLHARCTTGRSFPDGAPGVEGNVLVLTAEDAHDDTYVPRLMAADGDRTKVHLIRGSKDGEGGGWLMFPDCVPLIREALGDLRPLLFTIDPISEFLNGEYNSWKDADVRAALNPLARAVEEFGTCAVLSRHLNKGSGGKAIYRGGGSIGFTALARAEYLAAWNPDDPTQAILAEVKNNLAPRQPSLTYGLESAGEYGAARVVWGGTSSMTADLLCITEDPAMKSAIDEATEWLRELLENGAVDSKQVRKEAEAAGLSWRTVQRAKQKLDVKSERGMFGSDGHWVWILPPPTTYAEDERAGMQEG